MTDIPSYPPPPIDPDMQQIPQIRIAQNPTMLYINGSKTAHRCENCGANVFERIAPNHYRCNGCQIEYVGTPE